MNFNNLPGDSSTIRLTSATEARSYKLAPGERLDLWMFSAATMGARGGDPTKLRHSELLFDYLVDAKPVLAECANATGRVVPSTEVPFVRASSSSLGLVASESMFPPETEFCFLAAYLLDLLGVGGK